ncbi:MAG: class I SAM-dependent methyltransferase, partial [Acidobacteria bacterium]|nr:class I SAM-dependent methyltransferase [Acidobacteriota bacterium]
SGFVAGVDISDVMVRQAAKRNREFIDAGRVELCQGSVSHIPFEYARFDKVLAVNNYQFWPNSEINLYEIRRVLREDGLLVLCMRMHSTSRFALAPGFTIAEVEEVAGLVRWVGFRDVRIVQRRTGREASCVLAKR